MFGVGSHADKVAGLHMVVLVDVAEDGENHFAFKYLDENIAGYVMAGHRDVFSERYQKYFPVAVSYDALEVGFAFNEFSLVGKADYLLYLVN